VSESAAGVPLTNEERIDWLRLIRSENVGPRGIMAQTPQAAF
jgi:gluconate kinase